MKKLALILFILTMLLSACGNQPLVSIDIPADLEYTEEELVEMIEKKSNVRYTLIDNQDGSFEIQMTERRYERFIEDVATLNEDAFDEIVEKYDFIKEISFNEDFTHLIMEVDRLAYLENQTNHDLAPLIVAMFNTSYQFFTGTAYDEINFTIDFVDVETGEVIGDYVFAEDF